MFDSRRTSHWLLAVLVVLMVCYGALALSASGRPQHPVLPTPSPSPVRMLSPHGCYEPTCHILPPLGP